MKVPQSLRALLSVGACGALAASRPPPQAVDVWVTSGLENVFRDAAMPANAHIGIDLLAARGETESAQIVASATGGCLDSVRAEPSALAGDGGRGLGPSAVQVNWVGYVRLTRNSDSTPDAELLRRAPDDFPDPLLDDTSVTVCAGASQPLLVRVAVPRAAAPGVYRGTVSLRNGGTLLRAVPISVQVLPVTLPEIPLLSVTNWFSARAIAQHHHVPEWSEEHWRLRYAGDVSAQSLVHDAHPDKDAYFTECSGGEWAPNFADDLKWFVRTLIIGATRGWAKGVLLWNLALDDTHGPHTGGCGDCRGVVTIASTSGAVTRNVEYYALAHASRFVRPGAHRIASSTAVAGLETVAFRNADDGSKALLIVNTAAADLSFAVRWAGQSFRYTLAAGAVVTFLWS